MSEVAQSCPTLCDPWTVACTRLLRPWDFLGKSTGEGCHFLLQGIFPTQGSNPGLPHCRQTLYRLSHPGSPGDSQRGCKKRNSPCRGLQLFSENGRGHQPIPKCQVGSSHFCFSDPNKKENHYTEKKLVDMVEGECDKLIE